MDKADLSVGDYFLSAINPIANVDQRDIEARAMRIREHPAVRQADALARVRWRAGTGIQASAEQMALFDAAMDEWTFNYVLKAVNGDANHPRILRIQLPPHRWFGMDVAGGRIGGDNPNVAYRLIPIEHGAHHEVTGQVLGKGPADVSWTLVKNFGTTKTVAFLDGPDVVTDAEGRFTIIIDDAPADGRRNHLQTRPGVKFLFIRDALADWSTQVPNALRVRRLTPPTREPLSDDEIADIAAENLLDDVPLYYWFTRMVIAREPNTMSPPQLSGWGGGLVSQASSMGPVHLADDEAFVINFSTAGARYFSIALHDWWFRTVEHWQRPSSLNPAQMRANADGSYTCVIATSDPGVHNWLDTGGLHDVLVFQRWQGFPGASGEPKIAMDCRLVKRAELMAALPANAVRVTPEERGRLLAERTAAWQLRLDDGEVL